MCILDARPRLNAVANQAQKGGFESTSFYGNCILEFLDIANIHLVRDSYEKLKKAVIGKEKANFYSGVADSKWFDHMSTILLGGCKIAKYIRSGVSALVHCSDGWDRF